MIKPIKGIITAGFDDPRPFGSENPDHVHGAIDLAPDTDDLSIVSPEDGFAIAYVAVRQEGQYWPEMITVNGKTFPFLNYFYDMYGGIIVIRIPDGKNYRNTIRTHVITHCYGKQLFTVGALSTAPVKWIEQAEDERWPIHAVHTAEKTVRKGQTISRVGNAGFSTGPHVHWEIHHGYKLNPHADRIDPETMIGG